jgi:hypothetical protein
LKVWTRRVDSIGRFRDYPIEPGASKPGLLLNQFRVNRFTIEHERDEDTFAGTTLIGC